MTVGSMRTLHRLEDMGFEEKESCSSPVGAPDNFDHLFDHLSVSVQEVLCGSIEPPKSGNRLSTGIYRGSSGTTGTYVT